MGPVFRAYQPEEDRLVAVKLFRLDLAPDKAHQLVAEFEQLIAADLAHPGIAAPIAAGIAGVSAYLAQDFVAADSLDIVVRDGRSSAADVMRAATQLAGALDLAAAIQITHGALHPRDVLMSADDVRMTGLGVAAALAAIGVAAPIRRPYTAPERAAGERGDRRSDVFSLAVLVYELLTGRRVAGTGEQAVDALPDIPGADHSALGKALARALADQPRDRFATAGDFASALSAALDPSAKVAARAAVRRKRTTTPPALPSPVASAEPAPELPLLTDEMLMRNEAVSAARDAEPPQLTSDEFDSGRGAFGLSPEPVFDVAEVFARPEPAMPPVIAAEPGFEPEPDLDIQPPDLDTGRAGARFTLESPDPVESARLTAARADVPFAEPVDRERPADAFETNESPESVEAERTSSGLRALILALVVGIALGFGIAILVITRDRPQAEPSQTVIPDAAPPTVVAPPDLHVPPEPAPRDTPARRDLPAPAAATVSPARQPAAAATRASELVKPAATPTVRPQTRPVPAPARAQARAARPAPSRPAARQVRPPAATRVAPAASAAAAAPKTGPGTLVVDSRPAGARVFLDGRAVGTTPLVLPNAAVGEHAIHLDLEGFRRWATSVKISAGERSRVAASLEQ